MKITATGFGSGLSPVMPGTCGSIVAAGIWFAVAPRVEWGVVLAMLSIPLAIAVVREVLPSDGAAEAPDPPEIVIDEFSGFFVAVAGHQISLPTILLGFLFFRLFDILKPPPIRRVERLGGAAGVVLDDVVAGVFANALLTVVLSFILK